jgi:hypothetical protein
MNILEQANKIINERSEEDERKYGPIDLSNERAAKLASIFCNKEFTTKDVYYFKIALKLAREINHHKEDNLLDLVAFVGALNNYHNKTAE